MSRSKREVIKQLNKYKDRYITLNHYQFDVDMGEVGEKMEEAIGEKAIETLVANVPADKGQVRNYYRKIQTSYEKTLVHFVAKMPARLNEHDLAYMENHFKAYLSQHHPNMKGNECQALLQEISVYYPILMNAKIVVYDKGRKNYHHIVTDESMQYAYETIDIKKKIKNKGYLAQKITPRTPKTIQELHTQWRSEEKKKREAITQQTVKKYAGGLLEVEDVLALDTSLPKRDKWEIQNGVYLPTVAKLVRQNGYELKQWKAVPITVLKEGLKLKEQVRAERYTEEDEKYIKQCVEQAIKDYLDRNNLKETALPSKVVHEKLQKLFQNLRLKDGHTHLVYNESSRTFQTVWEDELHRYIKREIVYLCKAADEAPYNKADYYTKDRLRMQRLHNAIQKLPKPVIGDLRLKMVEHDVLPELHIKHKDSYLAINTCYIKEKDPKGQRQLYADKQRTQPISEGLNILRIWLMGREGGKELYELYRQSIDLRVREVVIG